MLEDRVTPREGLLNLMRMPLIEEMFETTSTWATEARLGLRRATTTSPRPRPPPLSLCLGGGVESSSSRLRTRSLLQADDLDDLDDYEPIAPSRKTPEPEPEPAPAGGKL